MALKQTTNSSGDIILSTAKEKYSFREPRGRDLVALERIIKEADHTDAETLAAIMSQHGLDSMTPDNYLDLPLTVFKAIGEQMLKSFRSGDN